MIISCPECKKEVSDQAATCPNCGVRIQKVQTIEKTGKGWKSAQLIGIVIFIIGCGSCCWGLTEGTYTEYSFIIPVCGIIILSIGVIGAWWHHG